MIGNDPYDKVPQAPSFRVTSENVSDGKEMPRRIVSENSGGANASPRLSWYGFPPATRSFVVTMYDADAPTPSGFWHWALIDIPGDIRELPGAAGDAGGRLLPAGARHLRNDAGIAGYLGPAPPEGHGPHRYFIAVHAVDVESLGLDEDTSPASMSFVLAGHTLARAVIAPWFEATAASQAA
jgi:Raf kinase inhibitor-like YbhB/YbcL family protein